jgi:antitoxin MazE
MQKLTRWGNSTGLRIPAEVLAAAGLKAGAYVYVRLLDSGDIRIRSAGTKQTAEPEVKLVAPAPINQW